MINVIVAYNYNRVIGNKGEIPWHIPEDLKRFKKLTTGSSVIMGRKTHESIGRILPNRRNIIVSRNQDFIPQGRFTDPVFVCTSLEQAIRTANCYDDEIFIIGGGQVYKEAIDLADRLYITLVKSTEEGDAHFPDIPNPDQWKIVERVVNDTHDYVTYEKKNDSN